MSNNVSPSRSASQELEAPDATTATATTRRAPSKVSVLSGDLSCSIDMSQNDELVLKGGNRSNNNQHQHSISDTTNSEERNGDEDDDDSGAINADIGNRQRKHAAVDEANLTSESANQPIDAHSMGTSETLDELMMAGNNGCGRCVESRGECCHRNSSMRFERGLMYCNRERVKLKDFSSEIRAPMDVEQFVHQAELLLDMTEVSVEDIVERMLERVFSNDHTSMRQLVDSAREAIFTPGSSMLMARTIQGVSVSIEVGRPSNKSSTLDYDQSWLCAICNLAQISGRHMIVARFKQPINMGDNAHEIRLFILIVTPSNEKGTKKALETGRTFATMFTDLSFRQRLLEARSETEFKSLMMVNAQRLSKAKSLKNRHKYMLDAVVSSSISSLSKSPSRDGGKLAARPLTNSASAGADKLSPGGGGPLARLASTGLATSGHSLEPISDCPTGRTRRRFDTNPGTAKLFELILTPPGDAANTTRKAQSLERQQQQISKSKADGNGNENGSSSFKKSLSSSSGSISCFDSFAQLCKQLEFGKGLWNDFRRRARLYPSDFKDAFVGPPKTVQKTVATIWFLYFGILLPTIAFSALNTAQTNGHMGDLRKAIIGQAVGGLGFALFGGQPLVIIMTTAPLCLYTKVIHQMCIDYGFHFPAMYAAVGLWNGVFLTIYSLFGFSKLMKWCTRSTEEIFALFIVIAFISDASKDLIKNFNKYYYTPACQLVNETLSSSQAGESFSPTSLSEGGSADGTSVPAGFAAVSANATIMEATAQVCRRETSLLFVLLMLGTLWLAITLYRFNKTPYLEASKRELLADYALPTSVIAMSFFGSYVFDDIFVEKFPPLKEIHFERAHLEMLPLSGVITSLGLGFTLSLLFFMDQNISAAMVNAPQNRLKKGCAYHFDLLIVGLLNGFLTLYGLPMMHGVLPHSPLHVRSLADIEERIEEGHLREVIVNVRETRVTGIVSHILLLGSLLLIPYPIAYIPTAVLNGLFLYMAITSLDGLQMFERILLLFTEQSKYPPNHYIRRCPQRKIHKFTMLQLLQLLVMCLFGFSPFNIVEMFFPVIILLMIPFRHKLVPRFIDEKYLDALDGKH